MTAEVAAAAAQAAAKEVEKALEGSAKDAGAKASISMMDEVHAAWKKKAEEKHVGPSRDSHVPAEFGVLSVSAEGKYDAELVEENPAVMEERKKDLESKYRIKFDKVEDIPQESRAYFRQPNSAELDVLERTLAKFPEMAPGSIFSRPLHITFLRNKEGEPNFADHGGIAFGARRLTIRRSDLIPVDNDLKDGKTSFGSVLMHELGHEADSVSPRDSEAMGFKPIGKDENGGQRFALQANDGRLYEFVRKKGEPEYWRKVDAEGKILEGENDSRLNDKEMQEITKVKQPMHPSNNPAEAFANAIRMYRQDTKSREELKQKAPEVYAYIERYDQEQIRKMGSDPFSFSEYKRNSDTTISKNPKAWNPLLM